jgi:hypothetical protein
MDLDEIFAPEVERYSITILDRQPIANASFVYAYPWGEFRLKIRGDLYGPARLEAAAVQVGRIALGHDFKRSGWKDERRNRREWLEAQQWAARRLIPWRMLSWAFREQWEPWELAETAGVTEWLAWLAWKDWKEKRGGLVTLPPRVNAPAWAEPQDSLFL